MATNASAVIPFMYLTTLTSPHVLNSGTLWRPPVNCPPGTQIQVQGYGAGAGGSGRSGSSFGSGGGAGAYATAFGFAITPNDAANGIIYTIGQGSVGTNNANSAAGGNTSFSDHNLNLLPVTNNFGANVGTNTLPSNWGNSGSLAGLSCTVIGFGTTTTGYSYTDIRLSGTTTGSAFPIIAQGTPTTLSASTTYIESAQIAIVAGSMTNIVTAFIGGDNFNTGYNGQWAQSNITPTATLTSYPVSAATAAGTTNIVAYVGLQISAALAVDITLRIAGWQLELGSVVTPWKSTPGYILAVGGGAPSGITGGVGGPLANCIDGANGYAQSGGNGAAFNAAGSGGGGAGGPAGNGANGTITGTGGQADTGQGGVGGTVVTASPGNSGANDFNNGGGGGGSLKTGTTGRAGNGGIPGGGGGAAVTAGTATGGTGGVGEISISFIPSTLIRATISFSILSTVAVLVNPDPVHGTNTLATLQATASLSSFTNASATDSFLPIVAVASVTQFDRASATDTFAALTAVSSLTSNTNAAELSSFFVISGSGVSGESDQLSSATNINLSCVSAVQNPYPCAGLATIEVLTAVATGSFQTLVNGLASFEILSNVSTLASSTNVSAQVTIMNMASLATATSSVQVSGVSTIETLSPVISAMQFDNSSSTQSLLILSIIASASSSTNSSALNTFEALTPVVNLTSSTNASQTNSIEILSAAGTVTSDTLSSAVNTIESLVTLASASSNTNVSALLILPFTVSANLTSNTNASSLNNVFTISDIINASLFNLASQTNSIEILSAVGIIASANEATLVRTIERLTPVVSLSIPIGATGTGTFFSITGGALAGVGIVGFATLTLTTVSVVANVSLSTNSSLLSTLETLVCASTMLNPPPFSAVANFNILSSASTMGSSTNASELSAIVISSNSNAILNIFSSGSGTIEEISAGTITLTSNTNASGIANFFEIIGNAALISLRAASGSATFEALSGSASLTSNTNSNGLINIDYQTVAQLSSTTFCQELAVFGGIGAVGVMSSAVLSTGLGTIEVLSNLVGIIQQNQFSSTSTILPLSTLAIFGQLSSASGQGSFLPFSAAGTTSEFTNAFGLPNIGTISSIATLDQLNPIQGLVSISISVNISLALRTGGIIVGTVMPLSCNGHAGHEGLATGRSLLTSLSAVINATAEVSASGVGELDIFDPLTAVNAQMSIPLAATAIINIKFSALGLGHNGFIGTRIIYWDEDEPAYSPIIRRPVSVY